jgi:hypothetical protein
VAGTDGLVDHGDGERQSLAERRTVDRGWHLPAHPTQTRLPASLPRAGRFHHAPLAPGVWRGLASRRAHREKSIERPDSASITCLLSSRSSRPNSLPTRTAR